MRVLQSNHALICVRAHERAVATAVPCERTHCTVSLCCARCARLIPIGRFSVRRAVRKSPTTTLVLAMSAMVPDVGAANGFLYFITGDVGGPASNAPTIPYPTATSTPQSTGKYNTGADTWTSVTRVPTRRQYHGHS